jgi:hypothetical protein
MYVTDAPLDYTAFADDPGWTITYASGLFKGNDACGQLAGKLATFGSDPYSGTIPPCPRTQYGPCPAVAVSNLPAGWQPPAPASNVCTPADIAAYKAAVGGAGDALRSSVGAACGACIFSKFTDAHWSPLVAYPLAADTDYKANIGACFAAAPGGSVACGQAAFNRGYCLYQACNNQGRCDDLAACTAIAVAPGGPCTTEDAAAHTACGAAYDPLSATCIGGAADPTDVLRSIELLCGGSDATDGGTEAGK